MFANWIALTILGSFFGSITRIIQKVVVSNRDNDHFAFSGIFQIMVSGIFLGYTLLTSSFELPNLSSSWVSVVAMVAAYALGTIMIFKAFHTAEASEVTIILASSSLWSVFTAMILLGETLGLYELIGIGLIILGLLIINYQKTDWSLNRGHLFAIAAAALYGFAFTNDAFILSYYNSVPSYMVIAFFLPGLATLLYRPSSMQAIPRLFSSIQSTATIIIGSITFALSALTIYTAYKIGGSASLISPVSQSTIIFTIVISYFFLGEKTNILKKFLGALAIIIGITLLV